MEPKTFLNLPVFQSTFVKETKGECFGVELELEGKGVALNDVATRGWSRHRDPSLRGESVEFTTTGAQPYEKVTQLVTALFKKFDEHKVKFNESIRTSTHVHLNFSDQPMRNVINFYVLFTLLEEVLQYYSGEDRKGNLFCLSAREAEGVVRILAENIAKCNLHSFSEDRYKYAACNLSTLYKFGTVEVRTMRGATSAEQVNKWLSILNDMYKYAQRLESPAKLINDLSFFGAEGLMRNIFSEPNFRELMSTFPAPKTLHYSLMEGARIVQVFAFDFEEDFLAKVDVKKIPAKRQLPMTQPNGRHWSIYRPDGQIWNVWPADRMGRGGHWRDGERLGDCIHIKWNEDMFRFVCEYEGGRFVPCNWRIGPDGLNEGPPPVHQPMPRHRVLNEVRMLDAIFEEEEDNEEDRWNDEEEDEE